MANKKKLEIPVTEGRIEIEDGKHTGTIVDLTTRDVPYGDKILHYVDFHITIEDADKDGNALYEYEDNEGNAKLMSLRTGCSQTISPKSNLGKILAQLGVYPEGKDVFDIYKLIGTRVSYMTLNETTERGTFANILQESIKTA